MKTRTIAATVRADPDRLLLASVEDLALSEGFRAYLKRLSSMRDKHVNELVSQADPTQFYRTQGRIEALGRAMEIHQILTQEIREKVKGKPQ
jgi:hypothetical protein